MRRDPIWPSGYEESTSGLEWLLYRCVALWGSVYGPSATKRPLGIWNFFPVPAFNPVAI